MRFSVISDIHANLEALSAVIEDISKENITEIYCLGDLVGYGANPNECVEIARKHSFKCIRGNHDSAALDLRKTESYNSYAIVAIKWTHDTLSKSNKDFLINLPFKIIHKNLLFIHDALTGRDKYILNTIDAGTNLELMNKNHPKRNICFFGHTHLKVTYTQKISNLKDKAAELKLSSDIFKILDGSIYLINPGAVGQPRDGGVEASYVIFDDEKNEFRYKPVKYDIPKAQQKIIDAGLPKYLSDRLGTGR